MKSKFAIWRSMMIRDRKKFMIFGIYLIEIPIRFPPSAVEVDSVEGFFVNWIASEKRSNLCLLYRLF